MQDSSAVPLTSHTAGRKQTSWFVWTPWCFAPSSLQGQPFNLLQHCSLIVTLRHTRALSTANALLTSSAANQMSGKTTSRNVNNANCGQPRGPIGACACRLLQLCLPLPLSVHLYSPSLSLSLAFWIVVCSCISAAVDVLHYSFLFRVAALSYYVEKKIRRARFFLLPQVQVEVQGKKLATMKRHLSDSEPEINEDYDECSR